MQCPGASGCASGLASDNSSAKWRKYLTNSPENKVEISGSHAQRNASIKERETQHGDSEPCILIADLELTGEIGVWLGMASLKMTVAFQGAASFQQGQLAQKGSNGRVQVHGRYATRMRNDNAIMRRGRGPAGLGARRGGVVIISSWPDAL